MNTKQAIDILETMTAEPDEGQEARLDADELDAVLYAVKILKGEEKPRGTWIKADIVTFGAFYDWIYKCSICDGHSKGTTNYCPYCGALMEKEETT